MIMTSQDFYHAATLMIVEDSDEDFEAFNRVIGQMNK